MRHGDREDHFRENVMGWIEHRATEAWVPEVEGVKAEAAVDFLTVHIKPVPAPVPPHAETQWSRSGQPSSSANTDQNLGQTSRYGRRHERYSSGPPTSSDEKVQRKRQKTGRHVEKQREDVVG